MAGNHLGDMYTLPALPAGETFLAHSGREPGRLRIGRSLRNVVEADVHPDCVAAYDEASALLAGLGHDVEDIGLPVGPDALPVFETLWYAMATLTPIDPAQEDQLLPFTRYLRERGQQVTASELLFAQAYLQAVSRAALEAMNGYDAVLSPTLASPPVPVGYFDEVDPAGNFERQKRFAPYTAAVQRVRAAGRERAAALERRRAAHRRHAGRPDRGGDHADRAVGADRGRAAVEGPPPADLVTYPLAEVAGTSLANRQPLCSFCLSSPARFLCVAGIRQL